MKPILAVLSAIAAITLLGACDSHPWSKTQVLHEKFHGEANHPTDTHAKDAHGAAETKAH
jgi:outer membrane lipopolysaccharide assembly protein LptE/RlpB